MTSRAYSRLRHLELGDLGQRVPAAARRFARRARLARKPRPPRVFGAPRWGNLRRAEPFPRSSGRARLATIVDAYVDEFVLSVAEDLHGEVLETGLGRYAARFGGHRVTGTQLQDADPSNRQATIVADLSEPDCLPEARFQSVLMIQTLQREVDVDVALRNGWRALAPGGTLLVSVPCIARLEAGDEAHDHWRFTPSGLELSIRRACPGTEIQVRSYGNLITATAALMGLAKDELTLAEVGLSDSAYPVVTCARARKAQA